MPLLPTKPLGERRHVQHRDVGIITGEINKISDRAAMGLPDHYVEPKLRGLEESARKFIGASPHDLVDCMADSAIDFITRLTAGILAGIVGDPRISAEAPSMIRIPRGIAQIGLDPQRVDSLLAEFSPYGVKRDWLEKECPRFAAPVTEFAIGKYPVTNAEYAVFLSATEFRELPTSWAFGSMPIGAANSPVYTVTPAAADAYVTWLRNSTGRLFRLPTEIEWEYAASGPHGSMYPWGDNFDREAANTMEQHLLMTTPVGIYPRGLSCFGIADMAGNVEEHMADTYQPWPGGRIVEDDLYKLLGHYRVARGGAFNRFRDLARCQRRHGAYPKSLYAIGFRLAEDIAIPNERGAADGYQ